MSNNRLPLLPLILAKRRPALFTFNWSVHVVVKPISLNLASKASKASSTSFIPSKWCLRLPLKTQSLLSSTAFITFPLWVNLCVKAATVITELAKVKAIFFIGLTDWLMKLSNSIQKDAWPTARHLSFIKSTRQLYAILRTIYSL